MIKLESLTFLCGPLIPYTIISANLMFYLFLLYFFSEEDLLTWTEKLGGNFLLLSVDHELPLKI